MSTAAPLDPIEGVADQAGQDYFSIMRANLADAAKGAELFVTASSPVVQLRGGVVSFGGRPVLAGVDLRVDHGEVVALLGANGSGKSTLVRALVGLVPLDSGEIELFGTPLRRFRAWGRIGYVPQRITAAGGVPATVARGRRRRAAARTDAGCARPARADRDGGRRARWTTVGLADRRRRLGRPRCPAASSSGC